MTRIANHKGHALLAQDGTVIGAFDAGLPLELGSWQWLPRVAADATIEIDCVSMADVIPGYRRLGG